MQDRTAQTVLPRGQRRSGGGAGGLSFCPAAGQFFEPHDPTALRKKTPPKRGQLVLPTKEGSGAVGHPFVEFSFLFRCQPHELLCRGVAHELFHLFGFLRLL